MLRDVEDRIQQLCAQVVATDDAEELNRLCVELRDALNQRIGRLRNQVRARLSRFLQQTCSPRKQTKGGMLDEPSKQRVKELCDLIAKQQDHHRFSSLVAELNRLLDDC